MDEIDPDHKEVTAIVEAPYELVTLAAEAETPEQSYVSLENHVHPGLKQVG